MKHQYHKCASTCIYIYIQVTIYMINTVHALNTPSTQLSQKIWINIPQNSYNTSRSYKNQGEPPALPSGSHIPDHSPCQPPLSPPPAWASVPGLVPSPPRAPPGTLYL